MTLADLIPWVLSCLGIYRKVLLGDKNKWGWLVGIVTQIIWVVYIGETKMWGFIPLFLVSLFLNIRNFRKWGRES